MKTSNYKHRVIEKTIEECLQYKGAILVEGAKYCGKTTTCEQFAKSVLNMGNTDDREQNLLLADIKPSLLLEGATPRLIDEWQVAPRIWDEVRYEVDHRPDFGQFILTGSAVPADRSKILHTGTGRFAWIKMRPMSLYESGESSGEISLGALFSSGKSEDFFVKNKVDFKNLAFLVCRGGWPDSIVVGEKYAIRSALDYVDSIVKSDIIRVDNVSRSETMTRQLLRSLARHQGTSVSFSTISKDIAEYGQIEMGRESVSSYMEALSKIFVIEDALAWNPNLCSKAAIRTSSTRYFTDPSIAAAALALGPGDLMNDVKTFGFLFETLCIRDLRVYAQPLDGSVYHFRTEKGLECDAVIHLRDGRYGLVEIKLGGSDAIENAAKTLKSIASQIDTDKMKEPSFLMVLVGDCPYAYQRPDGVFVVPVGTLKD
ncbi:MAG: ATP-binding protein [Aeriscardovia sp.]|nr:ATP-binding protein [Aeriscardovia sp.]